MPILKALARLEVRFFTWIPEGAVLTRYDQGLIYFLLLVSLLAFIGSSYFSKSLGEEPSEVVISLKGKERRYPLGENRQIKVGGCSLKVSSGKVRVTRSTCPRKLCILQGSIDEPGENIVCLPHQIVVTISGPAQSAGIDTISR